MRLAIPTLPEAPSSATCMPVARSHACALQEHASYQLNHMAGCLAQVAEGSTIIDLTGREPELLRAGKGDAGIFLPDPVYA